MAKSNRNEAMVRWLVVADALYAAAAVAALVALVFLGACRKRSDGPTGPGGGSWLVGEGGTMLQIDENAIVARDGDALDGDALSGTYEPPVSVDLNGIACRGAETAWVVGDAGALLHTSDGGATWTRAASGVTTDLRAVAAAHHDVVFAAGDAGVLLVSTDSGATWRRISTETVPGAARPSVTVDVDFTGVATTFDGAVALVAAADGSLWRHDGALTKVVEAGAPLHGVAITPDGAAAVAVGAGGRWLHSADGGRTFTAQDVGTRDDLFAVRVSNDGAHATAVGADGITVSVGTDGTTSRRLGSATLRALHLSRDGLAIAVGDAGTLAVTQDFGTSWVVLHLGLDVTLTGVDDLHGEPHL